MATTDQLQLPAEQAAELVTRWQAVYEQVQIAAPIHHTAPVRLLAVSKTHPAAAVHTLAQAGQHEFGENYVQEAVEKITTLSDKRYDGKALVWHFIGHIQRNKTKTIAAHFDWVHSVDSLLIAERLSRQRGEHGIATALNVCIQLNIDDEASKSGCQPEELPELVRAISQLPNLRLRGLMIIPAKDSTSAFSRTRQLFDAVQDQHASPTDWDTLSMGMSADMATAIAAGATIVRVGTAIFGQRPAK